MVAMTISLSAAARLVPVENGVMMYDYGGSIDTVYNPKAVAQHGILNYDSYQLTGDPQARQNFISAANWLLAQSVDMGNYSLWEYDFRWKSYGGVESPYASTLAQAEGIYVLVRAHNITSDECDIAGAEKAFGAFMVDHESGGVASDEGRDNYRQGHIIQLGRIYEITSEAILKE